MRSRIFLGALALLSALVFSVPANAANLGGTDYVLFAKQRIAMEQGPVEIHGDVGVNDVGGVLKVGAFNVIDGTATADIMNMPNSAQINMCRFNNNDPNAPNACDLIVKPIVPPLPILPAWPPAELPVPVIPGCVNAPNDFNVPADGTSLPAGSCRRNVTVGSGATLTLAAGTYNFNKLTMGNGSTLTGNGATVNLQGAFQSAPGSTISSVNITTVADGFEAISVGNSNTVSNSLFYAPFARIHLHTGGVYTSSEVVGETIAVQPIIITPPTCVRGRFVYLQV